MTRQRRSGQAIVTMMGTKVNPCQAFKATAIILTRRLSFNGQAVQYERV